MSLSIEDRTYNDVRWQCRCGRFIAESVICSEDHYDPQAFYGITTTSEYDCGRCGVVRGLPRCIVVGSYVLPDWEAEPEAADVRGQ